MSTFRDALRSAEAELFVGRDEELAQFRQWLRKGRRGAGILNVTGPPGTGKSALLRAFRRVALARGRTVVLLDVREVGGTPEALLGALGGARADDMLAALGESHLVLILDGVEAGTELSHFVFGTLLPGVLVRTQVVVAGREALTTPGEAGDLWELVIRPMVLEGLLPAEAQLFLGRGGLTDGRAQLNIIRIADGNPLALSLALRLAMRRGTHHLASSPEWQLSIRNLAERLLEEVEDPAVRPLVSACAVIGRVDESTLAAVSGRVNDAATFNRLCRLSIMRPTRHGIIVQPEARRILAQDLRWRRFDEYRALQAWARARNATATPPPKPPLASPPERPEMIRLANDGPPPPVEQLTPREREVLDLLASGRLASREIAARLVISVGTANLHVKRILHKLGFVTRAELAMWWMRRDRDAPIGSFQRDGLSSGRATPARPPWGT